jgi:predicted TIM-barrel fold metal-dependent hydrolase
MLGDYDSLPDIYTLADYQRETASLPVEGIVWSDAGAADPVAAARWVAAQDEGRGLVTGIVSLGDPAADGFAALVERLREIPLVTSVRVRLAAGLATGGPTPLARSTCCPGTAWWPPWRRRPISSAPSQSFGVSCRT